MKPKSIVQFLIILLAFTSLSSCIPDDVKSEMGRAMNQSQKMFADQEFKKALAHIELHKLRNGKYPNSLKEIEFLNVLDSTMYQHIEYIPLDSVYELNIDYTFISFDKKRKTKLKLKYPKKFWNGLGCVKSNTM